MPSGFGDDDPSVGMGFSILITVCSLAGLLFCFRRASTLLPRNLTIPLQMFGQNNNSSTTRGPIALSDDDLEGATRIDWDELDAQFEDVDEDGYVGGRVGGGASGAGGGQVLKPVTRQARYLDDDEDEEGEGGVQPFRTTGLGGGDSENGNDAPFLDDEGDDDSEELGVEVDSAPGKAVKKDRLFSLDDEESEHGN
ncbi:hypothetical protein BGZ95_009107 [Linnemannia exigua]|uniref:Uncharacterized protein n=1 Tax=Linnemannia exigua TaxID=604196 RepID=A0AAD4DDX2_9FUNG|nr:hypothetical protein BGZ95_009107 [Linnemannia exigua]